MTMTEQATPGRLRRLHTSMSGAVGAKPLIGIGCVGLIAAASLGFFLLKGGSDEEAPVVQATPSATFAPTAPPTVEQLGESYHMIIDKIGVDAPVVRYGLDENRIPVVP